MVRIQCEAVMDTANNKSNKELFELKQLTYELANKIKILEVILPKWFSLSDIAHEVGKCSLFYIEVKEHA